MPHRIERSPTPGRRVVIAGAGPAGLEAARVAAERGHAVTLFEAAPAAGGQLRIAARTARRSELQGIIDWRLARFDELGVQVHYNHYVEADELLALAPDVVIVATGGLPNTGCIEVGTEHVVTTWDIVSGEAKPAGSVLLYDDNGAHPGMQAAEVIARAGATLEVVSPERFFAPEIGGMNHVPYARAIAECGVKVTISTRVRSVEPAGNRLRVILGNDFSDTTEVREVDQVVVEHGTSPLTELYDALRPGSMNLGEVDYDALVNGRPQGVVRNPGGAYRLIRIGDAITSRNVHAAIYDGLRYIKDL